MEYREKKRPRLIHVGYTVTLPPQIIDQIRGLIPANLLTSAMCSQPITTAVLHVNPNLRESSLIQQSKLYQWYNSKMKKIATVPAHQQPVIQNNDDDDGDSEETITTENRENDSQNSEIIDREEEENGDRELPLTEYEQLPEPVQQQEEEKNGKINNAFLRNIYHRIIVKFDKKTNVAKSASILIIAHVMIDGQHLYLNVYNNTDFRPITVKKIVASNPKYFNVIKFEKSVEIKVIPYKH